jgi:hypothetical protein
MRRWFVPNLTWRREWIFVLAAACLLSTTLFGCGPKSGHGLVPVEGKVTLNGGPLPEGGSGSVTFASTDGKGNTATGLLDSSGRYRMSTFEPNDGVAPGEYKVSVIWTSPGSGDPKTGVLRPPASMIDAKFSNPATSGLTATVSESGNKNLDFDLKP